MREPDDRHRESALGGNETFAYWPKASITVYRRMGLITEEQIHVPIADGGICTFRLIAPGGRW